MTEQLSLFHRPTFQIPPARDTAIQFAPFDGMPIHLKAEGYGIEEARTVCGLALKPGGGWCAMGSYYKHRLAGSVMCAGCGA